MPAPRYTLISRPSNPVYRITAVSVPVEDLSNRLDGRWTVKPYPSYDRHLDGRTRQTVRCAALCEPSLKLCHVDPVAIEFNRRLPSNAVDGRTLDGQ